MKQVVSEIGDQFNNIAVFSKAMALTIGAVADLLSFTTAIFWGPDKLDR